LLTPVKLLPDAVCYFPELGSLEPALSLNGEWALEVDPTQNFPIQRCLSCAPEWLVFLERKLDSSPVIKPVSSLQAASRLMADLERMPPVIFDQYEYQLETIHRLVDRQCWLVQHSLEPEALVRLLAEICGSA
jgi:hypothetical protein